MDVVRITELQPKTYVEQGDYIAIDNQSDGTKKVQFTNLLDDTLSQENKIAPANVVGNEIATVRDEVEDEIATIRAAVGSPLKASTVAQMIDKNKIYVYVGSESGYTNGNWYYWNGSAWTSGGVYNSVAVVTDPTLTLSGVPADAKATGDEIGDLKSDLKEFAIANMTFEKNGLNNVGTDVTASNRARTQGYVPIPLAPFSIINNNPTMYQINIYWFDYNKTLLGQIGTWSTDTVFNYTNENIAYIRIGVKKSASGDMTDDDISAITNAVHIVQNISSAVELIESNLSTTMPIDYYKHIEDGYVWYIDGTNLPKLLSANYIASRFDPIFVKKGTILLVSGDAQAKLYAFDTDGVTPLYSSDMAWRKEGFGIVATQDCYWYINVALYPTATSGDIQDAFDDVKIIRPYSAVSWQIEDIYDRLKNVGNSYVIGSDLLRKRVNVQQVGKLTRMQSFCIYNGYFYSVDSNGNISKQDSDFNLISTDTISIGHANSFQLGSNGKAYASGWNNNTIYVVDLETMTVESSITLPTTGYTTGVVDDVNGIAYIFQRDSYPDTEAVYNFIVYDYVNAQILSTKKTIPFGALQACDLYEDRIIAVNGLGTSTVPNGYRVYDLDGNILANYVIADLESREPEGVAIDRDTGVLYISRSSGNLIYKVF